MVLCILHSHQHGRFCDIFVRLTAKHRDRRQSFFERLMFEGNGDPREHSLPEILQMLATNRIPGLPYLNPELSVTVSSYKRNSRMVGLFAL